ncbi:MAG: VOC family protein [Dehalococcoidia bacterium]|jgi:methylmalonyl-CoA epimerase
MNVERLDHIHIAVQDVNKAAQLLETCFGIKFSKELVSKRYMVKARIGALGSVGIELLEGTAPDSEITKFIQEKGEGLHAVSSKVPDIDEAVAELEAKGIKTISRFEFPLIREANLMPQDINGVLIELCQYQMGHPLAFAASGKSVE